MSDTNAAKCVSCKGTGVFDATAMFQAWGSPVVGVCGCCGGSGMARPAIAVTVRYGVAFDIDPRPDWANE